MKDKRYAVRDARGVGVAWFDKDSRDKAVEHMENCNRYGAKGSVKPYFITDTAINEHIFSSVEDLRAIQKKVKEGDVIL